jgi:hypothetical protein
VFIVTDDLRVRSKPAVSDDSAKYSPLLWKGQLAWVIEGPVRSSGYDWYLIDPYGEIDPDVRRHSDPPPEGWVAAASKDGEPWIEAANASCPTTPLGTVDGVGPDPGRFGLSCFGGWPVEFVAMASDDDLTCAPVTVDPGWLDGCGGRRYLLQDPGEFALGQGLGARLLVNLAPEAEVDVPGGIKAGTWVRVHVTGHYDDPRAQQCRLVNPTGDPVVDGRPELIIRACRYQFVVTKLFAEP